MRVRVVDQVPSDLTEDRNVGAQYGCAGKQGLVHRDAEAFVERGEHERGATRVQGGQLVIADVAQHRDVPRAVDRESALPPDPADQDKTRRYRLRCHVPGQPERPTQPWNVLGRDVDTDRQQERLGGRLGVSRRPQPRGECAAYEVRYDHQRTGQVTQHAHDVGPGGLRHGGDRAQIRVMELAAQPVVLDLAHLAHHQLRVEVPAWVVQGVDRGEVEPGRHL